MESAHVQGSLSPADIAKKLGLTVKALRVYEREGLVAPHRLSTGWRVYGPEQAESLHAVIALRGLGFTLKHIKSLMDGGAVDLGAMLTNQRQALLSPWDAGLCDGGSDELPGRFAGRTRAQRL